MLNFLKQNNVYLPINYPIENAFEQLYLRLREKEGRIYKDDEVLKLPDISLDHLHHKEWQVRKKSSKRLVKHVATKRKPLQILEIGCGNGWLSNKFSEIPQTEVIGLDINLTELIQAATIFTRRNLHFVFGDIRKNVLQNMKFDIIIFAASVQYFSSFQEIIQTTLQHLNTKGEIHIIDTIFYNDKNITCAKQRGKDYLNSIGFPEMINYYFYRNWSELNNFNFRLLEQKNIFQKIFTKTFSFPWICIKIYNHHNSEYS